MTPSSTIHEVLTRSSAAYCHPGSRAVSSRPPSRREHIGICRNWLTPTCSFVYSPSSTGREWLVDLYAQTGRRSVQLLRQRSKRGSRGWEVERSRERKVAIVVGSQLEPDLGSLHRRAAGSPRWRDRRDRCSPCSPWTPVAEVARALGLAGVAVVALSLAASGYNHGSGAEGSGTHDDVAVGASVVF
jgi:hypothetical protein